MKYTVFVTTDEGSHKTIHRSEDRVTFTKDRPVAVFNLKELVGFAESGQVTE